MPSLPACFIWSTYQMQPLSWLDACTCFFLPFFFNNPVSFLTLLLWYNPPSPFICTSNYTFSSQAIPTALTLALFPDQVPS